MFQSESDRPKASAISPTTLRLAPDLRARLSREATIAGHSLSQEIERRLVESFGPRSAKAAQAALVREEAPAWSSAAAAMLTEHQRLLLRLFAELSLDKQSALLTLLQR